MNVKMIILSVFMLISFSIYSLTVDEQELKSVNNINFINYSGKYGVNQSIIEIRAIGKRLAGYKKDNELFRYHAKYSVIRCIDNTSNEGLDADIISIDRDAKIDHVKNVRLIIAQYLVEVYGYKFSNAYTIATFITYYNAFYRGNVEYLSKIYKDVVLKEISINNAGISIDYKDWPGQTKIIIPLISKSIIKDDGDKKPAIEEVGNEKIVEQLKNRDDKGLDDRKEIVKLKENEIKEEKNILEEKKEKIELTKTILEEDKKELEKEKEILENQKKEIESSGDIENKKKIDDKLEIVDEKNKELNEKIDKSDEELKELEKAKVDLEKKEELIVKEKEDIKKDESELNKGGDSTKNDIVAQKEEELKQKEKELDKREDQLKQGMANKEVFNNKIYYLKAKEWLEGGHYNNELFLIDPDNKKIILQSSFKEICGRKFDVFSEGVLVISHEKGHNSPHILALLDRDTLELKIKGTDSIFWRSFIEVRSTEIFAIARIANQSYLAKFDLNLKMIARSSDPIQEDSHLTFYNDSIFVTNPSRGIVVFSINDLKLTGEILR